MKEFKLAPQLRADTIELGDLRICKALLMNDSQFPWLILVPKRTNITELYQLNEQDIAQVQKESIMISRLMMQLFEGDKLNTGALGNVVSQLHIHHIVRFKSDPVWPKPVWGNIQPIPYTDDKLNKVIGSLKSAIFENQSNQHSM